MSKKERNVLIAVAVALLIFRYFKNRQSSNSTPALLPQEDAVSLGDEFFGGGGGSSYVPSGDDDTDSLGYDPYSSVSTTKPATGSGETTPLVGDMGSGVSGKPAVGAPSKPKFNLSTGGRGPSAPSTGGYTPTPVAPINVLR